MIVHEEAGKRPRFERTEWKEWFRFAAIDKVVADKPMPAGYVPVNSFFDSSHGMCHWHWIWPLAPFVWIIIHSLTQWFHLARFFYRRGMMKNVKEGEPVSILWPLKLL